MKGFNLAGAFVSVALFFTSCGHHEVTANYGVIPMPQSVSTIDGQDFKLDGKTVIASPAGNEELTRDAEFLRDYIEQLTGNRVALTNIAPATNVIILSADLNAENPEAYELSVSPEKIIINGASPAGTFYGIQTLRKSIPETGTFNVNFPPVVISDYPRFSYRGAHFDTSRHMFDTDSIKSFIDMIAMHNINRFHWHITDDQGWGIEIKKYPELTEKGSIRPGTCIGKDFDSCDSIPYGGFYTQDQIRDIVKYAADRYITIVPEIDMPGHMLAALKAYPELGCTGGPYEVWTRWGVSDDVLCAGNDSVLTFIDGVLEEVTDLFPSEYIHVGGDECPKDRWKACPKCQAKARQLGIKAGPKGTVEEQLQSYIINHASNFLTSRGRKMIGWDETLEGGLAPGAIVMSWRGENGAVEAARQGHDAIMTPMSHCYFDFYQSLDRDNEPLAIGGYIPVEKIYSFEPVPSILTDDEKKHIIGVQANLWTEYIPEYNHVQYMELPRMATLSEVQWTEPGKKDYAAFARRVPQLVNLYKANGYRYATHIFEVKSELTGDPDNNAVTATFTTVDDAPVYYTLDGTDPTEASTLYSGPISLNETAVIKGVAVRPAGKSSICTDSVTFNKATYKKITLDNPPHDRYTASGPATLIDGMYGSKSFSDGKWMGFIYSPMIATIDLGEVTEINKVTVRTFVDTASWIFDATSISIQESGNGTDFNTVITKEYPIDDHNIQEVRAHTIDFDSPISTRYLRITVNPLMSVPAWLHESGNPAFVFIDEIMVD
ncbi:MAG: family 20 glycosylhydrolase [Muribaculaceae bacterium]|nr:family 20 glycosylhydrolase [Muribaculaceae bacterium]